jgi:K+-transporting ATPase ATPase C chain
MKENVFGSIRLFLALTVLLGLAYPIAVWGIGRVAFREKADGSFLRKEEADGSSRVVGSSLIGQAFRSENFFHSRPSAAGDAGYDATQSGGTNLGPTSKKLADAIRERVAAQRADNPSAAGSPVPADAVTSSASGLDPHISPEFALWQVPRVARETGLSSSELERMVVARTEGRFLGLWGAPRVNVLLLNLDLLSRLGRPGSIRVSRW